MHFLNQNIVSYPIRNKNNITAIAYLWLSIHFTQFCHKKYNEFLNILNKITGFAFDCSSFLSEKSEILNLMVFPTEIIKKLFFMVHPNKNFY